MKKITLLLFLFTISTFPQPITWTELTSTYNLPDGVKLYKGEQQTPSLLKINYLDVDMRSKNVAIRSYLSPSASGEIVPSFVKRVGAIAGINGGYFGSGVSYSAVIDLAQVLAKNIASVTRDGKSYPITRSLFGITETREMSIDWIYHFGAKINDIRRFENPSPNAQGTPAPAPTPSKGTVYYDLLVGIGGGPRLIKNGSINITYDQEVFWGSGINGESTNPRTAVGITQEQHVIMLTVDGRQAASAGVNLQDLAKIMLNLGCIDAMNLDGGGSTQLAAGDKYVNSPSEQRAVPTILAVVKADSVPFLPPIYFNKKIDNGDVECKFFGSGWTVSNIGGYWGSTPAQIALKGNGENYSIFNLNLSKSSQYDVFGWWVSASNRCKDTPFIIKHKNGSDTVRIDQTVNGSKWNKIGTFTFSGDSTDKVTISNAATQGDYVVVDAVRIISYDSTLITSVENNKKNSVPSAFTLFQNYPNPFNPTTVISYQLPVSGFVTLKVFDFLGNEIATLVNEDKSAGNYYCQWSIVNDQLPSGVYFYQLRTANFTETKKLLILK
ncbi:MAG: phosphodiester glycosidase family protein [Ignavibacteriales bacterium]|nr:phosphodiester glycosidase family protein [Ignavibacteriales bacterium]